MWHPPVGGERAQHLPLADQRHREDGPVALALDLGPDRGAERHRRIVQHVLAPHRLAQLHRPAEGSLPEGHPERLHELRREAATALVDQEAGGRLEAEDAEARHAEHRPATIHHEVQDAVDLECRADDRAHLEERLVLGRIAGGLVEEPRVLERHRRLRGEVGQGREILLGERGRAGPAPRRHHAERAVARHEGRGEQPLRERHELGHRVGGARIVVDHHGAATGESGPGHPVPRFEPEIADPVRDIHPGARAQDVALQQIQRRVGPPDQALGRARDHDQQLLGVELLGDVALDHPLRFESVQARRRRVAEPGPLDRQAHLLGHPREAGDLLGRELATLLRDERHHAPRPLLHRDRHRELGAVGPGDRDLSDPLVGGRRDIQVSDQDLPGAHRDAQVRAVHGTRARAIEMPGIEAALALHDELVALLVQAVDRAEIHPREAAHHLQRLARGGREVGAAGHRREHRVQRFELAVPALERHARAIRARPGRGPRRRARGQEREHHAREHRHAGPQQSEELQEQAMLRPRELLHRQHHPEAAVGRRRDGLREAADREGLGTHRGGAERRRPGPAARGQIAPAGREHSIPRHEGHRRADGQPVEDGAQPVEAPARHHRARATGQLRPRRALHRRGDEEVRLSPRQPQGQHRLGGGGGARKARRRTRGHLHQRRAARVTDRDEIGQAIACDGQHAGGSPASQDGPVSLRGALDHRGVAGEENGLPPQRLLVVRHQCGHRVHGP